MDIGRATSSSFIDGLVLEGFLNGVLVDSNSLPTIFGHIMVTITEDWANVDAMELYRAGGFAANTFIMDSVSLTPSAPIP